MTVPDSYAEVRCRCRHRRATHRGPAGPAGERHQCMKPECACAAFVLAPDDQEADRG